VDFGYQRVRVMGVLLSVLGKIGKFFRGRLGCGFFYCWIGNYL
jgi:hypothetical protein